MTNHNKVQLIIWVYKEFFDRTLDLKKDEVLIQNMITFFEVIEEVADKEQRLRDMLS